MTAESLALADQLQRRGTALVAPHAPWWYLLLCLAMTLWGSTWDTPTGWRWLPMLAFAAAILVLTLLPRRRAHPLKLQNERRFFLLGVAIAGAGVAGSLGVGSALATVGVPLPFTVAGLLLGIAVSLLTPRLWRWRSSYVERITQAPTGSPEPEGTDPVINTASRLALLAVLAGAREVTAEGVCDASGLSGPEVAEQSNALQEAGYLTVRWERRRRRPRTWLSLTPAGRAALQRHLSALR